MQTQDTSKEKFVADINTFIKNPTKENAKLYGAVKRFGVMPKQAFPEETIAKIANYMFDYDIDQPDWFEAHFNEENGNHKGNRNKNSVNLSKYEWFIK